MRALLLKARSVFSWDMLAFWGDCWSPWYTDQEGEEKDTGQKRTWDMFGLVLAKLFCVGVPRKVTKIQWIRLPVWFLSWNPSQLHSYSSRITCFLPAVIWNALSCRLQHWVHTGFLHPCLSLSNLYMIKYNLRNYAKGSNTFVFRFYEGVTFDGSTDI